VSAPELPAGTVTFLFTDVEGSTRLLRELRERYGDLRAEHERLLREAFAANGGQEIDTQGDSFFVAFRCARDAVAAAVAAQRALAGHRWPGGVQLRVRMGIHTGEPIAAEGRYVGLGVHRAARISAAGHGGQVLLSNATRELVEDDLPPDVRLRDLGEHRLKDIDRPERVFQLEVEGLPSQFPPLKTRDQGVPKRTPYRRAMRWVQVVDAPLVERERELEALGRVLEAARRGEGGAAVVEGPPGIGKSRLLAAAAAAADDLEVVRARASELEHDFPFGVVRQLFEPVLFEASDDERAALLAGAGALAERALADPPTDGEGAGDRFTVLHGLYWFAANLASSRPVLLLVDDAQWADAASLRWLSFLARRLEGVPLALVLAVRAGEAGGEGELLDELVSDPSVQVISPAVLSDDGVARLVELALGDAPDREFLTACQAATGGNPFLLRELLDELTRQGVGAAAENAPRVERLSATGVGRAVRARLRRLPHGCAELARAVSVLGDGCELPVAGRLAELDDPTAVRAADALTAASILEPARPLAFIHPLVRASVYQELAAGERSSWHARAARALAEDGSDVNRIAAHVLASDPCGDEDTVSILRAAADGARRQGANDVVATYLRRALREPPTPELEPQLLHELGYAELRAGEIEVAVEHLTAALDRTIGRSPRALVALELARGLIFTDHALDAVAVLSDAIDALSDADAELAARLVTLRAAAGWSSLDIRRRLLELPEPPLPIGATPRTTGERLLLARQATEEIFKGTAAQTRSLALRALGDGELLATAGAHRPAFYQSIAPLIWSHAFEDAEQYCQAALNDARRRGSEVGFAVTSHCRAMLCWQRGMLAELEADARAALARRITFLALPLAAAVLADALVERGDPEAAAAELRAAGLDAGTPAPITGALFLVARAHIELARQRPDDALALLLECGRLEDAWEVVTPALTNWRAEAALLLARLGESERALDLAFEAVHRADAFGSPVARGIALRAAALVARPPDHDGLGASVAVLRGSGARLELARSLVELGAAVRRSGRRADARDPLREGLEVAVDCGAEVLAARAHDELVAAGARPRRDPVESRATLTASELRVSRMAAEGLTNREIAQALFLTEKTIEVHLTRAYRKLEIQSRSQLARALPSAGAPSS
jgi:class 3 adenylate cyclase/DNA-binding CsgD family transcriptional regulator